MDRAYALLNVKAVVEKADEWVIDGIASTPTTDRMGDIVEPLGAKFKLPMPLLWQHNSAQPVGRVEFARPTAKGIPYTAHLPKIAEPGVLKDRVDEAVQSIKYRLVAAVSIGFRGIAGAIENLKEGGLRFKEWEWLELSLVTIPANAEATITSIKSLDSAMRAATGQPTHGSPPGDTGTKQRPASGGFFNSRSQKGLTMKTLQQLREERATKSARMKEIVDQLQTAGHEATDEETSEFDALRDEVKALDVEVRVAEFNATQGAAAKAVDGSSQAAASASRSGRHSQAKSNLPKGTAFVRYAMAMAQGRGSVSDALKYAERWQRETPEVMHLIKAAAGSISNTTWGEQLVAEPMREFLELLMPETIIGKINNFKRVPFNTKIIEQTGGSTVTWVGEAAAKPAGELDFDTFSLLITKVAGIVAFSDELARLSTPSAEATVRDDLIKQIVKYLDMQLLDPAVTALAGTRPASLTNTASPTSTTGTTAEHFRADMRTMRAAMRAANISAAGTALVMSGGQADALADMLNTLGQPEFPTITATGGTYRGSQVVVSDSVPGDSDGGQITLLKPSEILLADDGVTLIDVNRDGAVDLGAGLVSLWQRNMVAVRAERWIHWLKARDAAVQYIAGAAYEPTAS